MNILIRKGNYEDVPSIVTLGKEMHEESSFASFDWDNDKVINFADKAVAKDNFCFFVAEVDGNYAGMVIGSVQEFFFGKDLELVDFIWYVRPGYRNSSVGAQLIDSFIEFGKEKKCKGIYVRIGTNVQPTKTAKLLSKLGFISTGGMFVYKVN